MFFQANDTHTNDTATPAGKIHCQIKTQPSLCLEAAERPQWQKLYSLGRPRSYSRILSLVGDLGDHSSVASEAYHDWSGEAADAQLRVNFTLKLLLSQNFCNRPLMRFIRFASNIGPAAAVPAGPAPSPL